jgi:alkylhydroperoxidase family enzyme
MGGHARFLVKELGLDEETVRSWRQQPEEVPDTRLRAILTFARQTAVDPDGVTPEHIAALRRHGLDDAAIMEVTAVVLMSAYTNTLARTFRFDEDLEPLGMRAEYF